MFAVVIALRYLLPKDLFKKFNKNWRTYYLNIYRQHLVTQKKIFKVYGIPGKRDKDYTLQKNYNEKENTRIQFRKKEV